MPIDSSYAWEDRLLWRVERDLPVPEAPGQQGRGCGCMLRSAVVSDPSLQHPLLTPLSTQLESVHPGGTQPPTVLGP